MPSPVISAWHWTWFTLAILVFLALDLGVFHRKARIVGFREALAWTSVWCLLAVCFGFFIAPKMVPAWGPEQVTFFLTGYITELSLSMDNVFVMALIFAYFRVPGEMQHRVLFWGILGALVMRGLMILLGAVLIQQFHWMLYVFGAFLVLTGIKMLFSDQDGVRPETNPVIRLARRLYPISTEFDGQKFMTLKNGRRALTPLALVLAMVETTDLVFALDSIPAIFTITSEPFIVFTSNVFAILGLRSLYFVLAGALGYFRFLKYGLSLVLVFIGGKMLAEIWHWKMTPLASLFVVCSIIGVSVVASFVWAVKHPPKEL